jgi:cysteine desulfurase/selenocysteine lyase
MERIHAHERDLTAYALSRLRDLGGIDIYGPLRDRGGVISFNLEDVHPHDLATLLDQEGIAIRAGNHCAQPLMKRLNVLATARASFYLYNTRAEVDVFIEALEKARSFFGRLFTRARS